LHGTRADEHYRVAGKPARERRESEDAKATLNISLRPSTSASLPPIKMKAAKVSV